MPGLASAAPTATEVAQVRAFNRFYTNVIGVVHGAYLDTPYTLTEGRLLFEIAQRDVAAVSWLRQVLDIDAGYLSRVLSRFEAEGLVTAAPVRGRRAPPGHQDHGGGPLGGGRPGRARRAASGAVARGRRRRRPVRRDAGDHARAGRDSAAGDAAEAVLAGTAPAEAVPTGTGPAGTRADGSAADRGRGSWSCGRRALATSAGCCSGTRRCTPRSSAGTRTSRRSARRSSPSSSPSATATPGGRRPGSRRWTAGRRAASSACPTSPAARRPPGCGCSSWSPGRAGLAWGPGWSAECLRFAREAGYGDIVLWTYDRLAAARRIYQAARFTLVSEHAEAAFGHQMMSQTWRCLLGDANQSPRQCYWGMQTNPPDPRT